MPMMTGSRRNNVGGKAVVVVAAVVVVVAVVQWKNRHGRWRQQNMTMISLLMMTTIPLHAGRLQYTAAAAGMADGSKVACGRDVC